MPMYYIAIFHGCKKDNFQMKKLNIFLIFSQGYCRFRLFWKYAEIGYFGRLKLFPFQGLTRVHFSLFSENNGFLNIYMLK